MNTKILKNDILDKVEAGFNRAVDLVRETTGPRGGDILIDRVGTPISANDAGTIVRSLVLEDRFENMGVEFARDMISRLKDGRSATLIIAQEILKGGKQMLATGLNGTMMRRGIEVAQDDVVLALKEISKSVTTDHEIESVATVSSESKKYGKIIADVFKEMGTDGNIATEESEFFDVESKITNGFQIDRGYISPWMVTNGERMEADFTDVPILVTDRKIVDAKSIFPIMQKVAKSGKNEMVIFAEDIDGSALEMIIKNRLAGGIKVLGVKLPGYGDMKKESTSDLALLVGATLMTSMTGVSLEEIVLEHLGSAHRVIATKENTLIVNGGGDEDKIEEKINQIKIQISQTTNEFQTEQFKKRIANILGKVAVIYVGADTEALRSHLKLKIDDAVNSTRKAMLNGIIPGGGIGFIKAKSKITRDLSGETPEFVAGYKLVMRALEAPFKQIVKNAGRDDASVMIRDILEKENNYGYDADTDKLVDDIYEAGVIDSLEVAQDGVKLASKEIGLMLKARGGVSSYKEKE